MSSFQDLLGQLEQSHFQEHQDLQLEIARLKQVLQKTQAQLHKFAQRISHLNTAKLATKLIGKVQNELEYAQAKTICKLTEENTRLFTQIQQLRAETTSTPIRPSLLSDNMQDIEQAAQPDPACLAVTPGIEHSPGQVTNVVEVDSLPTPNTNLLPALGILQSPMLSPKSAARLPAVVRDKAERKRMHATTCTCCKSVQ